MQKAKIQSKNRKWDCVPILKYCDFERGTEPGSASYNREGGGVPFIRVGNIAAQIQEQIYTVSKNIKLCKKDDVLLVLDGSPGVVVRGIEGAFSSGIRRVIIKNPDKIFKAFILYVLQANFVQNTIKEYSTGVTIKHASKSLEYIQIPLPSFPEQQKIVKVLDTVREGVGGQEKIIELAKELKKSLLNEIFNVKIKNQKSKLQFKIQKWVNVNLGDVVNLRKEQVIPNASQKIFVGLEHIDSGEVKLKRYGEVSEVKSLKNVFYPNDILYGKLRPYLDKAVLSDRFGICSTDILVLTPKENVEPHFLIQIFHLPNFLNFAVSTTSGTNHPRTSWNAIKQYKFYLPPLPDQREIAKILQTVDQKIEIEQKKKALYEELFKTMLNKLMTGEIKADKLML